MNLKSIISLFALFIFGVFLCFNYVIASDGILKFQINLKPNISLKKNLIAITDEMKKTSKIFKTADQKVYWENEAIADSLLS